MGKTITIRRGYDIKLKGAAEKNIQDIPLSDVVAVKPPDFFFFLPKMLVEAGDEVLAGQALFFDKNRPDIRIPSPVSGEIAEIVRGEKRRIMEVRIIPDKKLKYQDFKTGSPDKLDRESVIKHLLDSGVWNYIRQRPFSIIANHEDVPKAIFVSCFDSAPLAPDLNFVIESDKENFQTGLHVLQTLAQGNLHVCLQKGSQETLAGLTNQLPDTNKHQISGPHPAGNVGIQIHHILPIQHKNDIVWYVNPQDVLIIGRLFAEGKYRAERLVALTGSSVSKPSYMRMISGQKLASVLDQALNTDHVRVIQGNVLSGKKSSQGDFLSFYVNQLTVIPEGDQPEFLGWLLPGFHKLSLSRTYFSWLSPNRKYNLDTNMHGELRAFVMTGQYDRVLPMNIYPVILLKAILAGDIEKMEALGIYEIAEEDFALCEFVCTSKIPVQNIVTQGLTLAREEG